MSLPVVKIMNQSLLRWERGFGSQLARLAIPIAIQSVVTSSMQIIDNVMIGYLGDIPLAAVTQANRISFLFQVTMFGVISGASIFVAQYWGRRDLAGVRRTLGIASVSAILIAALIGLPSILIPRVLAGMFLKDGKSIGVAAEYLSVMGFVYFIQAQSLVQAAVLKSTEQVRLPMFASIAAISTNVLFNWLLIFDHGSFGGYGVFGAAIATMIGALVELFILVFFAYRYRFATAAKLREMLPESRAAVRRFFVIALPVMFNETMWALGTVTYSAIYGRIGDGVTATAAVGIFNNFDQIASIAIRALCHACGVMIGMALGAGEKDRARLYAKRFLLITPLLMELLALLVLPLRGQIVGLFKVSAQTAQTARDLIGLYCCVGWVNAINCVVVVSVLRTGGDVRAAALIDVVPLWVIGVPVVAITGLVFKWDVRHVYLSTYLEQFIKSAICIWRMRREKWVRSLVQEES